MFEKYIKQIFQLLKKNLLKKYTKQLLRLLRKILSEKQSPLLLQLLRKVKIQYRLLGAFLILSLVPLLCIGFLSYSKSSAVIYSKISKSNEQMIKQLVKNINYELQVYITAMQDFSLRERTQTSLPKYDPDDSVARMKIEGDLTRDSSGTFIQKGKEDVAVIIPDSTFSDKSHMFDDASTGETISDNKMWKDTKIIDFINKENLKESRVASITTKKLGTGFSIVLAKSIIHTYSNKLLGYLLVSIKPSSVTNHFDGIDAGEGSEIFILTNDGIVIDGNVEKITAGSSHPDRELIKSLKSSQVKKISTFSYKDRMVSFESIAGTDWFVVCLIRNSYLNKESSSLRNFIIAISLLICFLALIVSMLITRSISTPLVNLIKVMKQAESGNLKIELVDYGKDEINEVLVSFSEMMKIFDNIIFGIRKSSDKLLESSQNIENASELSSFRASKVSESVQKISRGAFEQMREVGLVTQSMNYLSDEVNTVNNQMKHLTEIIYSSKHLSENGLVVVKDLQHAALQTSNVSGKIMTDINVLNSNINEIQGIVKIISDIAGQTKLLSLNASIEAAKAGTSSKGFGIIASEVKKLADKTKTASSNITSIVSKIQDQTQITVNLVNDADLIINKQMISVENTDKAFSSIFSSMENTAKEISVVENSSKAMLDTKDSVVQSISKISNVSEKIAGTLEEISRSTEEQTSSALQLSSLAKGFNELSNNLKKSIDLFDD